MIQSLICCTILWTLVLYNDDDDVDIDESFVVTVEAVAAASIHAANNISPAAPEKQSKCA